MSTFLESKQPGDPDLAACARYAMMDMMRFIQTAPDADIKSIMNDALEDIVGENAKDTKAMSDKNWAEVDAVGSLALEFTPRATTQTCLVETSESTLQTAIQEDWQAEGHQGLMDCGLGFLDD